MRTYYLAKILHKMRLSSFRRCTIHSTARIDSECSLSNVTMGKYSYVGSKTRITNTIIGSFCSIGGGCGIGGGLHPMDMVSTSPAFLQGRNILGKNFSEIPYEPSKQVIIGNDVWIGEGVCILSGVKIGDGSIVGAHAVVTKDVEPYTIVAGVPARELKKRFDKKIIERLLEIKWWDWNDEEISRMSMFFDSPQKLIEKIDSKQL